MPKKVQLPLLFAQVRTLFCGVLIESKFHNDYGEIEFLQRVLQSPF